MGDGAFWACEAIFYVAVGQMVRVFSKDLANLLKTFCELVLNTGAFGIRWNIPTHAPKVASRQAETNRRCP